MALESMANQFSGLNMEDLIGGPLNAACNAQMKLAKSTADFIEQIGFYNDNGVSKTRVANFSFERNIVTGKDELGHDIYDKEEVNLSVPMLAIVNIPSLMIDEVDITFDMEVSSSESHSDSKDVESTMSGSGKIGWGPLKVSVNISGKVATHSENTRKSDNSAKYHIAVHAKQYGTPEGLSRVLDIIAGAVAPNTVESPQARKDKALMTQLEPLARKKKALKNDLDKMKLQLNQKNQELELFKKDEENASKNTDLTKVQILSTEVTTEVNSQIDKVVAST